MPDIVEVVETPADEVTVGINSLLLAKVSSVHELVNFLAIHSFGSRDPQLRTIHLQWVWKTAKVTVNCAIHRHHFEILCTDENPALPPSEIVFTIYDRAWWVTMGSHNYRVDAGEGFSHLFQVFKLQDDDPKVVIGLSGLLAASNLRLSSVG
jgi:hypothetical protein